MAPAPGCHPAVSAVRRFAYALHVMEATQLRVMHFVDAMGGADHLWGKERVVLLLMREQRAGGRVRPSLVTFSPGRLADAAAAEGFDVRTLAAGPTHGVGGNVGALARALSAAPADVIHSHGYRANIVARLLRLRGAARGVRLISTCHGWVDTTAKLRLYNAVDRWTSVVSDAVAVPDARMLTAFPAFARKHFVFNGVPDREDGDGATFVRPGAYVVGTLGRVTREKGIADLLDAARAFPDPDVVFSVAGTGELAAEVAAAGPNVHVAGYVAAQPFLQSIDVYVQASHAEGLSLSLLEAMRAGKPIVATDVGATRDAVTDGESALLVPPRRPDALREAILRLRSDDVLAQRLGRNARRRFEAGFRLDRQAERYLHLYEDTYAAS